MYSNYFKCKADLYPIYVFVCTCSSFYIILCKAALGDAFEEKNKASIGFGDNINHNYKFLLIQIACTSTVCGHPLTQNETIFYLGILLHSSKYLQGFENLKFEIDQIDG